MLRSLCYKSFHLRQYPFSNSFFFSQICSSKCFNTATSEDVSNSIVEDQKKEIKEASIKKAQRTPFVKNLFLGKFDRDILTYPECLEKDQYDMLHEMLGPVEQFFKNEVDSGKIDKEAAIPSETLKGVKELGLFGMLVPVEYGGLGLNSTGYARVAEEVAADASIAELISGHQDLALKVLLSHGTEAQKSKYLPLLASGEWTAALCLTEAHCGTDLGGLKSTAMETDDEKGFILNGSKVWISGGSNADLFVVFARVIYPNRASDDYGCVSCFLVERSSSGVFSSKSFDKVGVRGSNTSDVTFKDTFIGKDNLIGEIGEGFKLALTAFESERLSYGSRYAGVLKNLMKYTVEHVTSNSKFGSNLSEFGIIQEKLAHMAVNTYAMEAMAYLTAGLMDTYENQDCSVEAAIVKIFSTEKVWAHASDCLQILGSSTYHKDSAFERLLRDIRASQMFESVSDVPRIFVALLGLQFAGVDLNETVKKLRNPVMHPQFALKTAFEQIRNSNKPPKLDLDLYEYLHPTLRAPADALELSTKKFANAVKFILGVEGKNISLPSNQINIRRVADVAIDLYALTAVLGRASRAYCIGVHNSDHDMNLASIFTAQAFHRIENNIKDLECGFNKGDKIIQRIAGSIFDKKGYAAESPITMTFW